MTDHAAATTGAGRRLFVVTAPGLEPLAAREVEALGIRCEIESGGVSLQGGDREMALLNLHLRTASRVLVRVAEFRARTFFELERHVRRVPWSDFLPRGEPVRLRVTSRKSRLYHERAIEERLLREIGAPLAERDVPEEEEEGAESQLFIVRFLHDRCVISADSSGALLHLRGYRRALARAPLRETLAAAMLLSTGWRAGVPLLDPLCGSGTIPIEAALIAGGIPPGLASPGREPRAYAFARWPGVGPEVLRTVVAEARALISAAPATPILGSDRDAGAIEASQANAARAGVEDAVRFQRSAVSAAEPIGSGGWLVTNPPYGVRVGETRGLRDLYAALGATARRVAPGGRLVMLSADRTLETRTGVPLREVLATRNGGIPVRVVEGVVEG